MFYSLGVPFSEENDLFPLWSDFSDSNISKIKERIQKPYEMLHLKFKMAFGLRVGEVNPNQKKKC